MIQYYDLKFSGYISRGSQFKYAYKLFEDIVNLLLLLEYRYKNSIPYCLHRAMHHTYLVISSVSITINYMVQIERVNVYKNMYQLLINFGFIMRNKEKYNEETCNSN
jgi:hypothetical protein